MKNILVAALILSLPIACSKLIGETEPKPAEPHSHEIEVHCTPVIGEPAETGIGAFPLACEAGSVMVGINRVGGLWKLICMPMKNECQVCIDGVCKPPSEL